MIATSAYQNMYQDLESYFNYDILQFLLDIATPELHYRGKSYCWAASSELFFFNTDLEFLLCVNKKEIDKLIVDCLDKNKLALSSKNAEVNLTKTFF